MIIVFFHVLYLFSRFIYRNYIDNNYRDDNDGDRKQLLRRFVDPHSDIYDDEEEDIYFSPPAYMQRYDAVATLLKDDKLRGKLRKVVDFGCSELSFVQHLKNTYGIEEILCVDIDRDTLDRFKFKIEPLTADYLISRAHPLTVTALEGSVTQKDQRLVGCDAVIAIELIEHLYPDTLIDLPYNIFGFIQPQVAVFTTPNADFNVLFKNLKGFRHWDHKFEWTREQFQDWAINITRRYPAYRVSFRGIAAGPAGTESLGCCSQMAIFMRTGERMPVGGIEGLFKVVASMEYPFRVDSRSDEEKILHEAQYYIRRYALNNDDEEMSLELLAKWMDTVSTEVLRETLENNNWEIVEHPEKGFAVLCQVFTEYSEYGENDDEDDDLLSNDDDNLYDNDAERHYATAWGRVKTEQPVQNNQDWPEIYDQDEDEWNNELLQESISPTSAIVSIGTNENSSVMIESTGSAMSEGNYSNELPGYSVDINVSGCESSDSPYDQFMNGAVVQHDAFIRVLNAMQYDADAEDSRVSSSDEVNVRGISQVSKLALRSSDEECDGLMPPLNLKQMKKIFPNIMTESELEESTRFSPLDLSEIQPRKASMSVEAANQSSAHCSGITANCASCQEEKLSVLRKLKGNLLAKSPMSSKPATDKLNLALQSHSKPKEEVDRPAVKKEYPKTSSCPLQTSIDSESIQCLILSGHHISPLDDVENTSISSDEFKQEAALTDANQDFMKSINEILEKDQLLKDSEEKLLHSGPRESPPNSWSPEIMDSGYPNTSSANDITPEYDLPSITQDRILESESPSLEEPARPNLEQHVEVENGDLANNNRDGEGNNLGPVEANDIANLQPLIDGLEIDMENENDIYDFQNGFPMWLLRILDVDGQRHEVRVGDHGDEGFDGSSSEDERADENENID